MIKFGSFSTVLNIPFSEFYKEFNAELHFKLKGISKKWYNTMSIEKNTPTYIRVWERKALHCNYYPNDQGNTVVEYTAEMTVFTLITWIITLFLIVGFLFFPIYLLGNRFAASQCQKKVFKHGLSCIRSVSTRLNNHVIEKIEYETINNQYTPNSVLVPPPVKKSASPPPLPINTDSELYYVLINDQQKGPFTLDKIALLIEIDQINPSTLVWKEGMANWSKASTIEKLNTLFKI